MIIHIDEPKHSQKVVSNQAKAILKFQPDAILFESPKQKNFSLSYFNQFSPEKKPKQRIEKLKQYYKTASKKYPWLKSEYKIFGAIEKLWDNGKNVSLFEIDAPVELTSVGEGTRGLLNIIWNYLREKYMVENIKKIKSKRKNKTVLIFCHNFHWKNIQFLLKNPSKNQIRNYFFTKNGINKSLKEIESELKDKNKTLYKYWKSK
jgi:hypothetical protein